ncbi:hypothetical protein [Subtercola endophyticus]|uniref:hypothetical protein n=1 Tax=Subtercola endophyticus TaxID=2895559 RepID=UPI001E580F2B|nr:hypothetical protein [Subtercola endophyticus]UFS57609.1 hypothetical protein LQ955_11110 [Subtercola endophyticus]
MDDSRRVIRVYADLGHRWPLWEDSSRIHDPTPKDLGLSPELEARMKEWYDFWELHHHWLHGWDSPENEANSWAEGAKMVAQLQYEVVAFADVKDERYRPPRTY